MLRSLLALLAGTILLVVGFIFSVVVLAIVAVLGLALWGYLWWKTRKLRRALQQQAPDGQLIDGEAVVVEEWHEGTTLPRELPRQ